jgi:hypothetical protein
MARVAKAPLQPVDALVKAVRDLRAQNTKNLRSRINAKPGVSTAVVTVDGA